MTRFVLIFLLVLSGCGPRPNLTVMPQADGVGATVPIFFMTTRGPDGAGGFGAERSPDPSFGKAVISVPPAHALGRLEITGRTPDPQKHFVALSRDSYDSRAAFRAHLARAIGQNPQARGEVTLFVHGYNTTFGEGLFRQAQLIHDFDIPSTVVNFSWPSAANPLAYARDSESALVARAGLEALIEDIHAAGGHRLVLVGHSLGAFLSMEVLRQIDIRRPGNVRRLVWATVLISPDLDVDLFRSQVAEIRSLPEPFVIFSSDRDRALQLSARINGEDNRLGNLSETDAIADLPVTIIEVTDFAQPRDLGHFTVGSSPTLINIVRNLPALDQMLRRDQSGRSGLVPGTILTVQNATQIILSPAEAVLSR